MRLDLSKGAVVVTLSRRNLLSLLTKLDQPWSFRTITTAAVYNQKGELIDGVELVVRAEVDATHYADREAPGAMHPATEWAVLRFDDEGTSG